MGKKKHVYLFVAAVTVMCSLRLLLKVYNLISYPMLTLLTSVCVVVAITALTKLITSFKLENNYLKFMMAIFMIYQLIIIQRGFSFNFLELKGYMQSDYVFWPFIIPIFIFFDKDLVTFAHLFKSIFVLAIICIIVSALQPKLISQKSTAEAFIHTFAFASGFILLNAYYLPKKWRNVSLVALSIGIASFVYLARRNGIVSYISLILAAAFLNLKNSSANKFFRIFPIVGILIMVSLLSLDFLPKSFTQKIEDRITEDSRTGVFENFFLGMKDYEIFGKGMNGKYYSPTGGGGINEEGELTELVEYRDVIENGYLQQYLNGGIVYIVLFQMIMLPAVFYGLFKSKNQFCQASGIIVFLWLIDMAIFGLPRLTLEYILVWICAGVCYTKSLREKTDDEVADTFENYEEYESSLVY